MDKAETQFKTGLKKIFGDGCLDDVEFCKQQLLDNPTWVAWTVTCKLFRNGSFAKMASIEALEASKENIAAVTRGRRVDALAKQLQEGNSGLEKERAEWERRIRVTEKDDVDTWYTIG